MINCYLSLDSFNQTTRFGILRIGGVCSYKFNYKFYCITERTIVDKMNVEAIIQLFYSCP